MSIWEGLLIFTIVLWQLMLVGAILANYLNPPKKDRTFGDSAHHYNRQGKRRAGR